MMSRIMLAIKLKSPAEMSPVLAIRTGNSAKSEIIRKFKKVCSECNKKRAECKHKEMF